MFLESEPAGEAVEISCDESGSEGQKLIGGNTDVFAHASVRMNMTAAVECVRGMRERAPSPALEYKAFLILRPKHRGALVWLLGESGPLLGKAAVHLIDKRFLVVSKVVDLLFEDAVYAPSLGLYQSPRAKAMAGTLYREGPRVFGPGRWESVLVACNDLLRTRNGREAQTRTAVESADAFMRTVGALRGPGTTVSEIVELIWRARPYVYALRERLVTEPGMIPPLDLLLPAVIRAVARWSEDGRPVAVVHDRQTAFTDARVAQLKALLNASQPTVLRSAPRGRLAGLTFVDSRSDPRIQVADVLAGAARKIASDALEGHGDAELTALLRPYLDPSSIWAGACDDQNVGHGLG